MSNNSDFPGPSAASPQPPAPTQAEPVAAGGVPSGMVLVPVEATEEMVLSAHLNASVSGLDDQAILEIWDAMLAEAPPAPASEAPTQAGGCQASGDWRDAAAQWLRFKSDEQRSINEAYPAHARACPSWRHRVFDRLWLAEELEAASAGAEPSSYDPGGDMMRTAIADGTCAPIFHAPPAGRTLTELCDSICAAIKAADDKSTDEAGYMLDSNDCIKIVRDQFAASSTTAGAQEGGE